VSTTLEQRARDALAQYFGADRAEGLRAATELLSGDFEIADADTVLAMNLARVVMATNHIVNREFDPAVGLASQIQTDGERFDIPELRARALRLRALRELFAGSASTALRLNSEALDQALRSGQSRLVAALSLDTAAGFIALNGHEKAMPLLQRLHRMLAPEEASSSRFFAHVLHAEASLGLGRLDEAHEQIGLAIHSFGTKAGERGRIYAAVIEARISRMRNDHKADDYFELWIDRARKLRYEQAIGLLHAEHGWRALDADGDAAKASRRFDESIDLLTERADAGIRLDVHTALADAYTRLGEGELAREAMRHAMTYMRSERDHHLHEIRELLELDGDLLEKGKLRAAEEAQRVLLDEMVEQLRDVHGDLKKHSLRQGVERSAPLVQPLRSAEGKQRITLCTDRFARADSRRDFTSYRQQSHRERGEVQPSRQCGRHLPRRAWPRLASRDSRSGPGVPSTPSTGCAHRWGDIDGLWVRHRAQAARSVRRQDEVARLRRRWARAGSVALAWLLRLRRGAELDLRP
jgi:tetratricopeptide (TPR) repeat protein